MCKGYDTHECAEPLFSMHPRCSIDLSKGTGTAQYQLKMLLSAEASLSEPEQINKQNLNTYQTPPTLQQMQSSKG